MDKNYYQKKRKTMKKRKESNFLQPHFKLFDRFEQLMQ